MLKIETSSPLANELAVVLSGWIRREHLPDLERLLREALASGRRISCDLRAVRLVDREAVDFLAAVAKEGVRLEHCPSYLREWLKSLDGVAG